MRIFNLFIMLILLCGCGDRGTDAGKTAAEETLPPDLQQMQGVWQAVNTNQYCMCEVSIDGPTIRLRYQLSPDAPMLKRNVSIRNVDEARKMLVMYNDLGGWPYSLTENQGIEQLELKFFDEINHEWAQVQLIRRPSPAPAVP